MTESCKHEEFGAKVTVQRLEDTGRFYADITVWCARCNLPFHFLTQILGLRLEEPAASADRTELRCPIMPGTGQIPFSGQMRFEMPSLKKDS